MPATPKENLDAACEVGNLVLKLLGDKDRELEELRWRFDRLKDTTVTLEEEEWLLDTLTTMAPSEHRNNILTKLTERKNARE